MRQRHREVQVRRESEAETKAHRSGPRGGGRRDRLTAHHRPRDTVQIETDAVDQHAGYDRLPEHRRATDAFGFVQPDDFVKLLDHPWHDLGFRHIPGEINQFAERL
jgi:hypothetical protein